MNEYSFWADALNKFHTSSDWIQALWLLVIMLIVLGVAWCVKETALAFLSRKSDRKGKLLYSIHRESENESLIYDHKQTLEPTFMQYSWILIPLQERRSTGVDAPPARGR